MFQKIKPVKSESAESKKDLDQQTADKVTSHNTQETQTANDKTKKSETQTMSDAKTKTDNNDVELDGLAKRSDAGAYSPKPATTTTAGFSSFPGTRNTTIETTSTTTTSSNNDERQLIIGKGINISGEIDACHHLVVEGQVDASLKGANILDIADSGVFYGSVEINEGSIAGRFEGDLKVEGRLTIRSTGTIIGSLSYGELEVEAGATIEGKIASLNATTPSTRSTTSTARTTTTTKKPATKKSTTSMDNELPFATKAAS